MALSSTASNLAITIGVDTGKLKADLDKATVVLQDWQKQLRAATIEAQKTGQWDRQQQVARGAQEATVRVFRLRQELTALTKAQVEVGRPLTALGERLRVVGSQAGGAADSVAEIAGAFRSLRGGIVAAGVYEGFKKITDVIGDAVDKVTTLQRMSKATVFSTETLQGIQTALARTNVDPNEVGPLAYRLSRSLEQARRERELAGQTLGGTTVLKGGGGAAFVGPGGGAALGPPDTRSLAERFPEDVARGAVPLQGYRGPNVRGGEAPIPGTVTGVGVEILRGNAPPSVVAGAPTILKGGTATAPAQIKSMSDAYAALNYDATKFTGTVESQQQYIDAITAGLKRWRDAGRVEYADEIAVQIMGKSYKEIAGALDLMSTKGGGLKALNDQQRAARSLVTDEAKGAADAIREATVAKRETVEGAQLDALVKGAPAAVKGIDELAIGIKEARDAATDLNRVFDEGIPASASRVAGEVEKSFDPLKPYFKALGDDIANEWNRSMDLLKKPGALPGPALVPTPYASGGWVRGAGTGTSDSIPARLSNGEFVVNATSVRRLGVGFLSAINSFASGGFVGVPPLRFASGGLASSADGGAGRAAVHLHIGSQSFPLSGASHVVDALVSEANRQQTRSAGVKPSWFAGRPNA
jgi:hypothetical protein